MPEADPKSTIVNEVRAVAVAYTLSIVSGLDTGMRALRPRT
jgi:hypothetical protein